MHILYREQEVRREHTLILMVLVKNKLFPSPHLLLLVRQEASDPKVEANTVNWVSLWWRDIWVDGAEDQDQIYKQDPVRL